MAQQIHLQPGDYLFRQGDEGGSAFIVESGRLRIAAQRRGQEVTLNELGAGEMLGELALLDTGPRTASAVAVTACTLTVVTSSHIEERINRAEPVLRLLLKQAMRHLRREIQDASLPNESTPPMIERIRLETELGNAIEGGELELWYQPIVNLERRCIAGFEALVRWRSPTRGLVPPGDFIPLAEECGLVVPLGEWVLKEACRSLADLGPLADTHYVCVNVSGRQLEQPGFARLVSDTLSRTGVPPSRLHLEATEGVLISSAQARAGLHQCKDIGVMLLLDDFGTGYSSLAYLNQLPFDAIKIDRGFAAKMTEEGDGRQLVVAMLGLARMLGRGVIMEGIETAAQRDALRALGGEVCQGYFFCRPLPLRQLREVLASGGLQADWG